MIKVNYVRVLVTRSVMQKIATLVMPHEVPILMHIAEDESGVQILNPTEKVVEVDPVEEHARLARKYRGDSSGSYVEQVYGKAFERRLEQAMRRNLDLLGLPNPKKQSRKQTDDTAPENAPEAD